MNHLINTPKPPYIAVIFTSVKQNNEGYSAMSELLDNLAKGQPGYMGMESVRDENGLGIAVSYWTDEKFIAEWKAKTEHIKAQKMGKDKWYSQFKVRVCKVYRDYGFNT